MNTCSIEKKYNDHNLLYADLKQAFNKANIKICFPTSNQVLDDLTQRIASIFLAIIEVSKTNNLYSAFILYRSLLEHFFKGMFLIDKMVTTLSDETAEYYQKHYFISEFLAEKAGVLEMEDLLNNNSIKTDFIQFLTTKVPELKGFDKTNQQEISSAIKQFSLKEIIKYLHVKYRQIETLQNTNHIIAQTLPEFSYVSSFTHGGAYASNLMDKFTKQNEIEKQLLKILQISLASTCVLKENFFMTYQVDKSFKEYILKLQSIRSFDAEN